MKIIGRSVETKETSILEEKVKIYVYFEKCINSSREKLIKVVDESENEVEDDEILNLINSTLGKYKGY